MARTVPVSAQKSPGDYITGALWNAGPKALCDWTTAQPVFAGYQATLQSVTSGTWTSLSIDTETLDSDGGHSNVTNTTRYTAQIAGTYLVLGFAAFAANGTAVRGSRIALNGTAIRGTQTNVNTNTGSVWSSPCWAVQPLVVGDYVEVQGFQNSGGALNTYNGTDCTTSLAVFWLST